MFLISNNIVCDGSKIISYSKHTQHLILYIKLYFEALIELRRNKPMKFSKKFWINYNVACKQNYDSYAIFIFIPMSAF